MSTVISHFDGHGATAGALLARRLGIPPNFIVCSYPLTDPKNFHRLIEQVDRTILLQRNIYVVDIPINLLDTDMFMRGFHILFNNARMIHKYVNIVYLDHHDTNLPYVSAIPGFVKYVHFRSALELNNYCATGNVSDPEDETVRLLTYAGALCDRDSALINRKFFQENRERLFRLSLGIDWGVRSNMSDTLRAIYNLDLAAIESFARNIPEPPSNYEVLDNVIVVRELLSPQWGPKQLEALCIREDKPYAVGPAQTRDPSSGETIYIIRVIKYWERVDLPNPADIIQTTRHRHGHPAAPTYSALSFEDALRGAEEFAHQLNTRVSIEESRKAVSGLENFIALLAKILENQTKLYEQYLELKRRQVELLERTTGESRVRYD